MVVKLLKNGEVVKQSNYYTRPQRREIIKEWQKEIDRFTSLETSLNVYEISITLKNDILI